jgi:hypothetical protein
MVAAPRRSARRKAKMVPEGPRPELYWVVMFELDAPAESWLKHRWIPVAAIQNESGL